MAQQIKLAFPANNDDDKENELHLDLSSDPDEDYSSPIKGTQDLVMMVTITMNIVNI